jgi:hypothetical protein
MNSTHNQDSGRKSADGGKSEDIRAKLARYKQERDNFEQVRMQFRQKHQEIEKRDFQNHAGVSSTTRVNTNPDVG